MKYAIGSNMPGYMPDNEPGEADTLADAKECLLTDITLYLEDLNLDGETKYSALHDGQQTLAELEKAKPQQCNAYIGNYVFWITEQ